MAVGIEQETFKSFCRWKVQAQKGLDSCPVITPLGSLLTFSKEHSWPCPESPSGAGSLQADSLGSDPTVSGKTAEQLQTGWLLPKEDWRRAGPLRTTVGPGAACEVRAWRDRCGLDMQSRGE